MTKAHLYVMSHTLSKFLRCKNDEDCVHSMNAPALILEDL
jgi:hypothetical protein